MLRSIIEFQCFCSNSFIFVHICTFQLPTFLLLLSYPLDFCPCRWLSGSDLKKVALFGCPSVERKIVFAAKSLRSFFSIHEDTVSISASGCFPFLAWKKFSPWLFSLLTGIILEIRRNSIGLLDGWNGA